MVSLKAKAMGLGVRKANGLNMGRVKAFLGVFKGCEALHIFFAILQGNIFWHAQLLFSWNATLLDLRAIHICFSVVTQPRSYYQRRQFPWASSWWLCANKSRSGHLQTHMEKGFSSMNGITTLMMKKKAGGGSQREPPENAFCSSMLLERKLRLSFLPYFCLQESKNFSPWEGDTVPQVRCQTRLVSLKKKR